MWTTSCCRIETCVADAFATAAATWGQRGAVDEVYLVDSARRPVWIYPLKLGDRLYPDLHEFHTAAIDQSLTNNEVQHAWTLL